jgi:hypothetical protein
MRAQNDGKAIIDGQGVRLPVNLEALLLKLLGY